MQIRAKDGNYTIETTKTEERQLRKAAEIIRTMKVMRVAGASEALASLQKVIEMMAGETLWIDEKVGGE